MNELKKANTFIRAFIESGLGLEDGISKIKLDLQRSFHFSNVERFNRQALRDCYAEFETWLNGVIISQPPPEGVKAMHFGLYDEDGSIGLYVSGCRRWSLEDPGWACDNWYLPEGGRITLSIYKSIATVFSEFNHTGLYLSVAILATLIREYTMKSMISLLDIKRDTLYIACGFVDGDLFNVGRLTEDGLQAPGRKPFWRR